MFLAVAASGRLGACFPPHAPIQDERHYYEQQRHALAAINPAWTRSQFVRVGNPHCVTLVDSADDLPGNQQMGEPGLVVSSLMAPTMVSVMRQSRP